MDIWLNGARTAISYTPNLDAVLNVFYIFDDVSTPCPASLYSPPFVRRQLLMEEPIK